MTGTRIFAGRCHCGNVEVAFETAKRPEELGVRACSCSFCRRHGARTTSVPAGRARIGVRDPARLNRYRFNLKSVDFLVCRDCGTYLGALLTDGDAAYCTLNVNAFETPEAFPAAAASVSYDRETEAERLARRKAKWTPAEMVE